MTKKTTVRAAALAAATVLAACTLAAPVGERAERADSFDGRWARAERPGAPDAYVGDADEVGPRAERLERPEADAGLVTARRLATDAARRPRSPALLARPVGGELEALPLEALRVVTTLQATRARVLVECTFSNPHTRVLQGTFAIDLPDGATPSGAGMYLDDGAATYDRSSAERLLPPPLPEGGGLAPLASLQPAWEDVRWGTLRPARVVEVASAARTFEAITSGRAPRSVPAARPSWRCDPLLIEWSAGASFRAKVFPIPANGKKRLFFTYDLPTELVGGRALLTLPAPSPVPPAFRLELAVDPQAYEDAALLLGGPQRPFTSALEAADLPERGACLLAATPRSLAVQAGSGEVPGVAGQVVHTRLRPTLEGGALVPTGDAVFLLDTSLSQRAALGSAFARLLAAILERDESVARHRVIAFDVEARSLFEGWRRRDQRGETRSDVEGQWLAGATDVGAALRAAEAAIDDPATTTVFLLSDGCSTWRDLDVQAALAACPKLRGARVVAYRVGEAPLDRAAIEPLCAARGQVVEVTDGRQVEAAALAHRVALVALDGVSVEGVAAKDLVVRGDPRALRPGQLLEVAFRLAPGADARAASIVVRAAGGAQRFGLEGASANDPCAARAWGELVTERLLARHEAAADATALALSQRFGLVNRVASLLMVESDDDYTIHAIGDAPLDLDAVPAAEPVPAVAAEVTPLEALLAARSVAGEGRPWRRFSPDAPTLAPVEGDPLPVAGQPLDGARLHAQASAWRDAGRATDALRLVSSLVEERSTDPLALRLVGYTCLAWGRDDDAAALFARVAALRPWEPQAHLCEALAHEAGGRLDAAVRAYERAVLARARFEDPETAQSRRGAALLYGRLLRELTRRAAEAEDGALFAAADTRLAALERLERCPAVDHLAVVLWNLDETDVDLHVREAGPASDVVSFKLRRSSTGGTLAWDAHGGLGPEVWRNPTVAPAEISAAYFGTQSLEGQVPAAALLVYFRQGPDGEEVAVRSTVLGRPGERQLLLGGVGPAK